MKFGTLANCSLLVPLKIYKRALFKTAGTLLTQQLKRQVYTTQPFKTLYQSCQEIKNH
jgi:hypothetical protein